MSCKACFLDVFSHRFRASLRKNLKIWKDDLNLIALSGGSNSMAMMHLLYSSLLENQGTKKMFFRVHIIYIDEGKAVYNWSDEESERNLNLIKE